MRRLALLLFPLLAGCWLSDAEVQERLDADDTAATDADTGLDPEG